MLFPDIGKDRSHQEYAMDISLSGEREEKRQKPVNRKTGRLRLFLVLSRLDLPVSGSSH